MSAPTSMRSPRITVVLADKHPIFLQGLELTLQPESDIDIVALATTDQEVLRAIREHRPDVLVAGMNLPGEGTLGTLRLLRGEQTATRFIVVAAQLQEAQVIEALRLGVRGMLLKDMPSQMMPRAIRKVHAGGQWLEKDSYARALESLLATGNSPQKHAGTLSARESELVRLVGRGLRNRDIAERLGISESTVKTHLYNIFKKIGVGGRVELALYARAQHMA